MRYVHTGNYQQKENQGGIEGRLPGRQEAPVCWQPLQCAIPRMYFSDSAPHAGTACCASHRHHNARRAHVQEKGQGRLIGDCQAPTFCASNRQLAGETSSLNRQTKATGVNLCHELEVCSAGKFTSIILWSGYRLRCQIQRSTTLNPRAQLWDWDRPGSLPTDRREACHRGEQPSPHQSCCSHIAPSFLLLAA